MKKFTLLAGLALVAGAAYAAEPEVVNNLKMSTVVNELDLTDPANDMYYYRISNMRIQRASYIKATVGNIYDGEGYEEDNILDFHDTAIGQAPMPTFLPGKYGDAEDLESCEPDALTPQLYEGDYKYMGLAAWDGNWWIGFSSLDEIVNPNTRFWYFTKGKNDGTVYIHNAVQQGSVKRDRNKNVVFAGGATRATMGFDTKDNMYFVQPVEDALMEAGFEMQLTDAELKSAFALSTAKTWSESSDKSLDCNNYVNYTLVSRDLDEDGEQVFNADGDSVYRYYGFVGADRTWSPIRIASSSNSNHEVNNGTLWFVTDATIAEANAAINEYTSVIVATYKEAARKAYVEAVKAVAAEMEAYVNLPALIKDQNALQQIIAECSNPTVNTDNVKTLADVDKFGEMGAAKAQNYRAQVGALVGHGAVVTFKNMTAFRDAQTFYDGRIDDEEVANELAYGNAYIAAGQAATFNNGSGSESVAETGYKGIGPMVETTPGYDAALCQWELIPVWGTATFKLYNAKTNTYIMNYNDSTLRAMTYEKWEEDGIAEDMMENASRFTWATTEDESKAAAFTLRACPAVDEQNAISANDSSLLEDPNLNISTDVVNNVYLESTDVLTGSATAIHRASSPFKFKFISYNPENNRWYADPNVFHVDVVVEGSINDIAAPVAPKAQGIYDLQGRKVAKAQKGGLYIINGVKTIVR